MMQDILIPLQAVQVMTQHRNGLVYVYVVRGWG